MLIFYLILTCIHELLHFIVTLGGERAWYTLIAHALSITQNLGDRIRVGYLPRILVFQYVNHRTSR